MPALNWLFCVRACELASDVVLAALAPNCAALLAADWLAAAVDWSSWL
jgi:hypothetical protein